MTLPLVFVSYSHEDEAQKNELMKHLQILESAGLARLWVDDRIGAGSDWQEAISQAITEAEVAILLISVNFLVSDFIQGEEIPALLQRRNEEGLTVFPVIARDCVWQSFEWLRKMNVRPKNGEPIWGGGKSDFVDQSLTAIVKEVRSIVEKAALEKKPGQATSSDLAMAGSVVDVLSLCTIQSVPELVGKIGQEAALASTRLYALVQQYLGQTLSRFEDDPEAYQSDLTGELAGLLRLEPGFKAQLVSLVKNYEQAWTRRQERAAGASGRGVAAQAATATERGPRESVSRRPHPQVEHLQAAMRAYVDWIEEKSKDSAAKTPGAPYKGLFYFEMADEQIFFGREPQIELLLGRIQRHRLTVLHGVSGAGKTSLINAGLMPMLLRHEAIPLYPLPGLGVKYQNPEPTIYKRITSVAPLERELADLSDLPLSQFLRLAGPGLDGKTLVIFLDGFEDFFIHLTPKARYPFITELANCHDDETLPVKFVVSLREEYFPNLHELEVEIPTVFYSQFRLEPLSVEQAYDAILKPVRRLGIRYEQNLIDTIVGDLGRENIEPLQLQIVCEQLYENRSDKTLTLADYEQMGRAEGILAAHLKLDLTKFGRDRPLAEKMLIELITVEGTKQTLTQVELVAATVGETATVGGAATVDGAAKVGEADLDRVLKRLVDYRLVRKSEYASVFQYELAHEYFTKEIKTWISDEQLRLKAVKELLERELSNWRNFHTLIDPDRLQIIEKWVERGQLPLSQEAQELIDESRKQRTLDEQEQLQLIQFAKMTSLDQLVLGIDHELSSPVASIRSNSQFLQEDVAELKSILDQLPDLLIELSRGQEDQLALEQGKKERADDALETRFYRHLEVLGRRVETWIKDGELRTVLEEIDQISDEVRQAVAKMMSLIKALSNFVQPTQAIFKPTNLQTGLETAVFLLGYQLKYDVYSIEVRHQHPESLLTVNGSASELIQLFINVLLNSIEAIKSRQAEALKGVIEIGTYQDNSWGVVIISDNGGGIPVEDEEKVFAPGFTSKGAAHRGIGLSIARQIVERHDGLIEVTSELQKGTTVKISLPLIDLEDSHE